MKIAKDYKEQYTEAMRYGTEVHGVAEDFISDDTPIPEKFAFLEGPLKALKRRQGKKFTDRKSAVWVSRQRCLVERYSRSSNS
jgi:hypothetical protein